MSKVRLSFAGGFHNSPARNYVVENGRLRPEQAHKVANHLCGVYGCKCGHMHGAGVEIKDEQGLRYEFDGDLLILRER